MFRGNKPIRKDLALFVQIENTFKESFVLKLIFVHYFSSESPQTDGFTQFMGGLPMSDIYHYLK